MPPTTQAFVRAAAGLPPGSTMAKWLICSREALRTMVHPAEIARVRCPGHPQIEAAFRAEHRTKAAVGIGTLSDFADALSATGITVDAWTGLVAGGTFGALVQRARRVAFQIAQARELGGGGAGAWRGEGGPTPSMQTSFDTFTLGPSVADVLVVVTDELFRFGRPTEAALIAALRGAVNRYLTTALLDPTIAATADHPGSLTNAALPVTSTGSTAAQIITDLSAMIAGIQTGADGGLLWILRPVTLATIYAKLAGVGMTPTPGFLLGWPVLTDAASPQQITLADPMSVAIATDEEVIVEFSNSAAIEMDDAPSQSAASGTGASLVSLFQVGGVGLMASLRANWTNVFEGAASPTYAAGITYMTVTY